MRHIAESFWKSEFAQFVESYGVDELAERLAIQPSAIYLWIRGSTAPRPGLAQKIQRVALERKVVLTLDQIYGHFLSAGAARFAPRLDSQWK